MTTTHHQAKPDEQALRHEGAQGTKHLRAIARIAQRLPAELKNQLSIRPGTTLAAVGGVAFASGALFGSRFGRLVVVVAAPVVIRRLLEGEIGRELAQWARQLFERQELANGAAVEA